MTRWDPWEVLAAIGEGTTLHFADLGGLKGLWQRDRMGDLIILDPSLSSRERRAVLAHELIHAERGIGHGAATADTMTREEEMVRREVARRLVPPSELAALIARERPEPVDVALVGDEFDVPDDVAALALHLLRTGRGRRRSRR